MNHWTDSLPLWQRNFITYTSPGLWLGVLLIVLSYVPMVVFCQLTNTEPPKRKER